MRNRVTPSMAADISSGTQLVIAKCSSPNLPCSDATFLKNYVGGLME
jgi:hypothetical protein